MTLSEESAVPRRRRPRAGVDPRRSDVIAQVSLCCCCCFTFQLLKRSGDGSMNYREVGLSSGRRLTRSHVDRTLRVLCSLCFLLNFLCIFLSNGGDRGLRVRKLLLRQYGFDVCLWRVDRHFVTSRLHDESTGWRVDLWRVDRVTSQPGDELTVWRVDWQPLFTLQSDVWDWTLLFNFVCWGISRLEGVIIS